MKKARNSFVSNEFSPSNIRSSCYKCNFKKIVDHVSIYRSSNHSFHLFFRPHPLFPLSLSVPPPECGSKRCAFRAPCSQTEFSSVHTRAHTHTHREEEGRTGDSDIFPWGRESCSARRRPVSQYISGMHGAFHDKIFQYWHPVSIYRAAREIRRAVGTYLYEFHFGWLYSRYSAGGSAGKMVGQRWTNHFDGACTLTISITFR